MTVQSGFEYVIYNMISMNSLPNSRYLIPSKHKTYHRQLQNDKMNSLDVSFVKIDQLSLRLQ